jgi:hypothetical protein
VGGLEGRGESDEVWQVQRLGAAPGVDARLPKGSRSGFSNRVGERAKGVVQGLAPLREHRAHHPSEHVAELDRNDVGFES